MLKLEEELSRFAPIDLKTLESKLGVIPDDVRTSISMYNKAIDDIRNDNEDMAVIALRKAISMYPGFYEAMNLMGLCHVKLGEDEKARELFAGVVRMDDSSLRAKEYLDRMDGTLPESTSDSRVKHRTRRGVAKALPIWLARGLSPERQGPWGLKYLAGFLLGFLLMGLLWTVKGDAPLFSFNRAQPELQTRVDALAEENQTLKGDLADTAKDLANANLIQQTMQDEMAAYKTWTARLGELRAMVVDGAYRDVIMKIEKDYQGLEIPSDIQTEIIAINNEVKPKALKQIYEAASALYKGNAKNKDKAVYQQAMTEFDLAVSIVDQLELKPSYTADLYYMAAKAYFLAGTPNQEEASKLAVDTFNKLIAFAPKTAKANSAATWINEIQAGRSIKP